MDWIVFIIKECVKNKFSGSIRVNFYLGGVTGLTKEETFKPPQA